MRLIYYYLTVALSFFPAGIVNAADPVSRFIKCEGAECSACNLVELGNELIIWLFGIIFLLFAVLMTIAGFGLVTSGGNTSALSSAKDKFTNAMIGILIIMSAWLIVDTLMKSLVGSGENAGKLNYGEVEGWGPWAEVKCQVQTEVKEPVATPGGGVNPVEPVDPSGGAIRSTFASNNISINKPECPVGVPFQNVPGGCTSVEGLNPRTVQDIIALRNQCGAACPGFTITGGNELGHGGSNGPGTHGGGDKYDLRTDDVNSFIMGPNFRDGFQGSRRGRVNITTGTACVREDIGTSNDHWDCRPGG